MQSVKPITLKRIKTLPLIRSIVLSLLLGIAAPVFSQDNSPYTRYGIGDLVSSTHISGRGMGSISAGFADFLSINFNNPASYASFQAIQELKSRKISSGRTILDLGLNFESRTLREGTAARKFVANNALFSYVQVGVPVRRNWGISFGLRPVSRISYKIIRNERLKDPLTGLPIDSAITLFEGDGGAYLASLGTGFSLFRHDRGNGLENKLSIGFNGGILFGKKDYSTRRSLINDTVSYYQANYESKTNFNNLHFNGGIQYRATLSTAKKIMLTLGAYGEWKQNLNATRDVLRETFVFDPNQGNLRLDSVSDSRDVKGTIVYPASFTAGFVIEKFTEPKKAGWLFGVDFMTQKWDQYRFYGLVDSVRNKWELRAGAQLRPVPKRNYFSNVAYRAGFFVGPDYIKVQNKLPQFGASFGLGLPVANYRSSYSSANQATIINLAFEYIKRGNSNNLLREDMFRVSVGFSLSDFWFIKRKYD